MKYENIEAATALCQRIKALNQTLESLSHYPEIRMCVSVCKRWDGMTPVIKEWSDTLFEKDNEEGMFIGEITDFILSCQRNVAERIERLHEELEKL